MLQSSKKYSVAVLFCMIIFLFILTIRCKLLSGISTVHRDFTAVHLPGKQAHLLSISVNRLSPTFSKLTATVSDLETFDAQLTGNQHQHLKYTLEIKSSLFRQIVTKQHAKIKEFLHVNW